jgi:transcriptional regulator with XRE-family HTH domain
MINITQKSIAQMCGISEGHLSQVLSGVASVGKRSAMSFGKLSGRRWTDFLTMTPKQIRSTLTKAIRNKQRGKK